MEFDFHIVKEDDLWEFQTDLTSENVCSRVFEYFDLPNVKFLNDVDSENLVHFIKYADSVFLCEVEMSVENRVSDFSELFESEVSSYLSKADEVFLVFVCPDDNPLTDNELEEIQNFENEKFWSCLNYQDSQITDITLLYIIAIKEREGVNDENEVIDSELDDITDIPLGEYKVILRKQASDYAKSVVADSENHTDAALGCMTDFLCGASAAIELSKNESITNIENEFDSWEFAIFDDIDTEELGEYKQVLMSQAMSYAESVIYPNNDKTLISITVVSFLNGTAAALKVINASKTSKNG